MHTFLYKNILSSKEIASAEMSINRWMYNENVVLTHNGNLFSHKENEIMKFTGKWIDLEIILLSEETQTQKDKKIQVLSNVDPSF